MSYKLYGRYHGEADTSLKVSIIDVGTNIANSGTNIGNVAQSIDFTSKQSEHDVQCWLYM